MSVRGHLWARRVCMVALATMIAVGAGGCDEGEGTITAPGATGTVGGVVTIDGAPAPGITVTLSTGVTATTSAAGLFAFQSTPAGAYTVTISGFPSDVSFTSTTQAVVLVSSGQLVAVNFVGTRVSGGTTHNGTLSFAGGDSSHNTFVFNAPGPKSVSLSRSSSSGTTIRLTPVSGFSPSTLPELNGTVSGSGAVSLTGSGTIAGVPNVQVTATGTLVNGRLDITITVGADGRLPGGQPIQYRYVDN